MGEERYCIYCHTNKINGKRYIGMTRRTLDKRCNFGWGYTMQKFGQAIKEHGWHNFTHEILIDNLTREEAIKKEREYILEYNTMDERYGYNVALGWGGGFKGHHHTPNERKRISEKMKKYVKTEEHRKHIGESKRGIKHHRAKKVYQYTKDGEFIREWEYMNEAATSLKIAKTSISATCNGKRKSAGGYVWTYERM